MRNFDQFGPGFSDVNIRVWRADTGEVLYQDHNVIVNVVKWLFARLMANSVPNAPQPPYLLGETSDANADPLYGIWGLALGAGSPTWAPETQPDPTPVQTALFQQILRKPLSRISYVDQNFNPLSKFSTMVDFQTTVNATTDNITQGIREMGLIGGGTINLGGPTNMLTAPYFDPSDTTGPGQGPNPNSVVLINYKTLPPLILPAGVDIIFSWVLSF
jgi:hypothetical protein